MEIRIFDEEINLYRLLRKCGYHRKTGANGKRSYVKSISRGDYPRFHIYPEKNREKKELVLSLHLDMKEPSYPGSHAHQAEYDSAKVREECKRVAAILQNQAGVDFKIKN